MVKEELQPYSADPERLAAERRAEEKKRKVRIPDELYLSIRDSLISNRQSQLSYKNITEFTVEAIREKVLKLKEIGEM